MLTRMVRPGGARLVMAGVAALALWGAPVTFERAQAGGAGAVSCVGSAGAISCAGRWEWTGEGRRRQLTEQEEAESAERHRKWVARCRPVIKQDQFGVGRYFYAAPGCEYGKYED